MKYHYNFFGKRTISPAGKPRYYFRGNQLYLIPKNPKKHFKNHTLKTHFKLHHKPQNHLTFQRLKPRRHL